MPRMTWFAPIIVGLCLSVAGTTAVLHAGSWSDLPGDPPQSVLPASSSPSVPSILPASGDPDVSPRGRVQADTDLIVISSLGAGLITLAAVLRRAQLSS